MPQHDLIEAMNILIDKKLPITLTEGYVLSKGVTGVQVRIGGSTQVQEAWIVKGANIEAGDFCILARPKYSSRWVVIAGFNPAAIGRSSGAESIAGYELSPPNNISSEDIIPGAILLVWDVPPQQTVTFEVQTNTAAIESGTTSALTTRGAYAIIPTETDLYCRVRSISAEFEYSRWSDWTLYSPGTETTPDLTNVLIACNQPVCLNGEFIIVDS